MEPYNPLLKDAKLKSLLLEYKTLLKQASIYLDHTGNYVRHGDGSIFLDTMIMKEHALNALKSYLTSNLMINSDAVDEVIIELCTSA